MFQPCFLFKRLVLLGTSIWHAYCIDNDMHIELWLTLDSDMHIVLLSFTYFSKSQRHLTCWQRKDHKFWYKNTTLCLPTIFFTVTLFIKIFFKHAIWRCCSKLYVADMWPLTFTFLSLPAIGAEYITYHYSTKVVQVLMGTGS